MLKFNDGRERSRVLQNRLATKWNLAKCGKSTVTKCRALNI